VRGAACGGLTAQKLDVSGTVSISAGLVRRDGEAANEEVRLTYAK
jgi:hypothetical protein